jgi:hypothetical protein
MLFEPLSKKREQCWVLFGLKRYQAQKLFRQ